MFLQTLKRKKTHSLCISIFGICGISSLSWGEGGRLGGMHVNIILSTRISGALTEKIGLVDC